MQNRSPANDAPSSPVPPRGSFLEVLLAFFRLGLISFGGPVAHLGYFRDDFVARRKWLDERSYADLMALCQFLPGPSSSQVGIGIGIARAGLPGALAAWLGFTLPSALIMIAFAYGIGAFGDVTDAGWLHGLKVVAVAVVALAVWGMAKNLSPDRPRATMAIVAAIAVTAWQTAAGQVLVILVAGIIGWRIFRPEGAAAAPIRLITVRRGLGIACLVVFAVMVAGLPIAAGLTDNQPLKMFDGFFRTGSLVFGGGHVMLPLLQSEVVSPGWVTQDEFIAGYGAAQAIPGPLSTFAAYLGTIIDSPLAGWTGGVFALAAIFLPSFLLVIGVLPFWDVLRAQSAVRGALTGVNAAVVGILAAALYDPVWTSAIEVPSDFALALGAFGLLAFWKAPPWLVVVFTAVAAEVVSRM